MNIILLAVVQWAVLVTEGFEDHVAIQNSQSTMTSLHFQVEPGSSGACDMKSLVAVLVGTLNARAHPLAANIAGQLPPCFWHFFHIHHRLHERVVAQRYLRNPHRAEQMRPLGGVGLLKRAVCIGAEDACL